MSCLLINESSQSAGWLHTRSVSSEQSFGSPMNHRIQMVSWQKSRNDWKPKGEIHEAGWVVINVLAPVDISITTSSITFGTFLMRRRVRMCYARACVCRKHTWAHSHLEVLADVFCFSCTFLELWLLPYCLLGLFKLYLNFFGRYLVFRSSSWFASTHVHRTMAAAANFNLKLSSADQQHVSKPLTWWLEEHLYLHPFAERIFESHTVYRYIRRLSAVTL